MLKKNALNSFTTSMKNLPSSLPNDFSKDSTMTYPNSLNYPNVLRLLADEIEKTNQLKEQIKQNAAKVDAVNQFAQSYGDFPIRLVAQWLNLPKRFFLRYLRDKGILSEQNKANAEYCKQGFLIQHRYFFKQKNGHTKTFFAPHITPAGMVHIYTLLWNDGIVPVIDDI